MNALQVFNYNKNEIRTIVKDGEPWFVAKDVCDILEIGNVTDSICRLEQDEFDSIEVTDTIGRMQKVRAVNEHGLYSLILGSRKPEAKDFKRWITHEVLPSIRKTGGYMKPMTQMEIIAAQAQQMVELERKTSYALEAAQNANSRIESVVDIFTRPTESNWRESMNSIVRGICKDFNLSYVVFYGDLYKELEETAHVDLVSRLSRLKARLIREGATKTHCNAIPKLEIVERDTKLRPIFEGIVRKHQAKYASQRFSGLRLVCES